MNSQELTGFQKFTSGVGQLKGLFGSTSNSDLAEQQAEAQAKQSNMMMYMGGGLALVVLLMMMKK